MTASSERFAADLARLTRAGRVTPCRYAAARGDHRWLSEVPDEREAARADCAGCPLITACLDAAIEERSSFGVRGGVDFTHHHTRRAARRQHHNARRIT